MQIPFCNIFIFYISFKHTWSFIVVLKVCMLVSVIMSFFCLFFLQYMVPLEKKKKKKGIVFSPSFSTLTAKF